MIAPLDMDAQWFSVVVFSVCLSQWVRQQHPIELQWDERMDCITKDDGEEPMTRA